MKLDGFIMQVNLFLSKNLIFILIILFQITHFFIYKIK